MTSRILIVDDQPTVRDVVARYLQRQGFETLVAADGEDAVRLAPDADLLILDVMLPTINGLEVCRQVRAHSSVPIIMLTVHGRTRDKVAALGLGADDYVVKPFSPSELTARVRSILRRAGSHNDTCAILSVGQLHIDTGTRIVRHGSRYLDLTEREFDLLVFLAKHEGQVFSREQLFRLVWGYDDAEGAASVPVYVHRLRAKLEQDRGYPRLLKTVWGTGYTLEA